jgi:hypothetical protein
MPVPSTTTASAGTAALAPTSSIRPFLITRLPFSIVVPAVTIFAP